MHGHFQSQLRCVNLLFCGLLNIDISGLMMTIKAVRSQGIKAKMSYYLWNCILFQMKHLVSYLWKLYN